MRAGKNGVETRVRRGMSKLERGWYLMAAAILPPFQP